MGNAETKPIIVGKLGFGLQEEPDRDDLDVIIVLLEEDPYFEDFELCKNRVMHYEGVRAVVALFKGEGHYKSPKSWIVIRNWNEEKRPIDSIVRTLFAT